MTFSFPSWGPSLGQWAQQSEPVSPLFTVERWAGISDGWLTETEALPLQTAEKRLRLRRAVSGDLWRYRLASL